MRIQHNITALNSYRNLKNNNTSVANNLEKLSSGYKINRAGDDAAGLAISEKMRSQITGLETAQKNANDGVSLVQTAEGALTEVHSMLNRMVELATQSANGTYSSTNRDEMQKEIEQLKTEINRISKTANFNGTTLFSKFTGANAVSTTITLSSPAGTTVKTVEGIQVKLHVGEISSTDAQIIVTLAQMDTESLGIDGLDISDQEEARAAIDKINAAIDAVSSMRSTFGALQNRLDHTLNNLSVQTENLTAAESRIRDVDMAEEMMAYTKNNILVQASQAMLAQANQVPQGVLQLLQ
ncbi:MAG: flagellin [Lachnospiraceae bacterium]|nr:flagellin [Lachnospiraceae bacterium]